jgi:hypothetical protein
MTRIFRPTKFSTVSLTEVFPLVPCRLTEFRLPDMQLRESMHLLRKRLRWRPVYS